MIRAALILFVSLAPGAVVPLTPQQEAKLARAVDGQDHRQDPAFDALVENVRGWTPGLGDTPIRLAPDYAAMAAIPQEFRGDVCRIQGRLEQHARLDPPYDDVGEWFVRGPDGLPIVVYIVGASQTHQRFADGGNVEVDARFYKRIDALARDGLSRSYPAFVGAFPRIGGVGSAHAAPPATTNRNWIVAIAVIALGFVFALALIAARRSAKRLRTPAAPRWVSSRQFDAHQAYDTAADSPILPQDPAEALATLKRRAGPQ